MARASTYLDKIEEDPDDADLPEICFGYLEMERPGTKNKWDKYYIVLDLGELFAFDSETNPGSRTGKKLLDNMDLDQWALALPSMTSILLSPTNPRNPQVFLRETNAREYQKWATAFNEHINYMNVVMGRVVEVNAAQLPPAPVVESPRPTPAPAAKAGPPASNVKPKAVEEEDEEYIDKRGIRMTISSRTGPNKYAEETLQILRDQLIKEGKMPLEFIPLPELKAEMSSIFVKANNGDEYDEARLDYLLKCMDLNPEYKREKERETAEWRKIIGDFMKECLKTMRGFVPPHIFNSTVQSLTVNDKLPVDLAKRIFSKRCLWLVRVSTADISKMHIAELIGRFNPEGQGLDIIEMGAIFAMVPLKFLNDDAKGSKEKWRMSLEENLKSFYTQMKANTLAKLKLRNPVYKGLTGFYTPDEVYHSMHVTSGNDAFNPRLSFRNIRREKIDERKATAASKGKEDQRASFLGRPDF